MELSVVICTYNPKPLILERVLEGLRNQTLEQSRWELIIVDNCSVEPVAGRFNLSWHPEARVVREEKPGLSHARIAGISSARSTLIVFADDDNVLEAEYLAISLEKSTRFPKVGCFGGRSIACFETDPPAWFHKAGINLGCQDFGDELYVSDFASLNFEISSYPAKAPIGTGMVIRKEAFNTYLAEVRTNPKRLELGRRGQSLSSGEDNDIILTLVKKGYELAYFPDLVVHHLIPAKRYSLDYLRRMAFESNRTWVKVLALHGIATRHSPINKWTYIPRIVKSFLIWMPWCSPLHRIRFETACGINKGLIEIQ